MACIDRAWRGVPKDRVANAPSRIEVYHYLRLLLMEKTENKFRVLLQQFLSFLERNEKRFYTNFKENYCSSLDQWASCFRVGTVVNTNMFLETFHRLLKVVYFHHKQNRRVDYLMNILLKVNCDKIFEHLTKIKKGTELLK